VFAATGFLKERFEGLLPRVPQYYRRTLSWVDCEKRPYLLNFVRLLVRLPRILANVLFLVRVCKRHNVDVIHTNTVTLIEGALAAWILRIPHCWQVRELLDLDYYQYLWPKRLMCRIVGALSDCIVCNSQRTRVALQKLGVSDAKLRVIYNLVTAPSELKDIKELLGNRARSKTVAYVGWITPNKRLEDFVAVAAGFVLEDVAFVILGDWGGNQPYNESILKLIETSPNKRNITVSGVIPNAASFLASADVLLCPCFTESFGRTVAEALAVGTPAIGVGSCADSEIIDDGASGILVDAGDTTQMETGLRRLLSDEGLGKQFGSQGVTQMAERFAASRVVSAHAEMYREVLSPRSKSSRVVPVH
jgi:glycosyltransferase involved in cell wall biosynthesis